mgnify:CR=1 FL=1
MKYLLSAFLLASPAILAAEPPPQAPDSPEVIAQLKKDAAALEQQVKASPKDAELYVKLGFAYARLHQADDAQRAFETAVTLDPSKAIAHYMLGLIYEKKGMHEKAVAAWKACLENTQDPRLRETAVRHLHHLSRE